MGFFFGGSSKTSSGATGFNRFQKQSASGVKKTLAGLSLEKRKRVEAALGGKIRSGLSNDKILRAVGTTLGYGAKQQVIKAMTPKADQAGIKERMQKNLAYARSQRVAEERNISGGLSNVNIMRNAMKGVKSTAADLGIKTGGTSVSINASGKSGGFAGTK